MDFKNLKKTSPIFILLFGVFASAQLPPFSFLKSSSAASVAPTGLALTHSTRNRGFTVSWTAGSGNNGAGGCKLQYFRNGTTWTDLSGTYNCDASTASAAASLPSTNSWTNNFNGTGVQIRLVRNSDSSVMGTFPQSAKCTPTSGSASSTPTIDEDCNARWDNLADSTQGCSESTVSGTFAVGTSITCNNPPAPCNTAGGTKKFRVHFWGGSNLSLRSSWAPGCPTTGSWTAPPIGCTKTGPNFSNNWASGHSGSQTLLKITIGADDSCTFDAGLAGCQDYDQSWGSMKAELLSAPRTSLTNYRCYYQRIVPLYF